MQCNECKIKYPARFKATIKRRMNFQQPEVSCKREEEYVGLGHLI